MPTRVAPPPSAAQELIAALTGFAPATETPEQTAAQELLAELFGIEPTTAAQRGEDYFTAHADRRRPAGMAYSPIPPKPGVHDTFSGEMEWIQVDSSNVDKIAYDAEAQNIYVQFLSGALYVYYRMPPNIWANFLASNSKGMFVFYILRRDGTDPAGTYDNVRTGQRFNARGENKVTPIDSMAEIRSRN